MGVTRHDTTRSKAIARKTAAGSTPPAKTSPKTSAAKPSAAKSSATKTPVKKKDPRLVDTLAAVLDDNKAEEIVIVPLEGKSSIADFMIIASGRSSRHVAALAEMIGTYLKDQGQTARYEGKANGDWVVADAGDVIIHLFRPEVRSFYNIEKIWLDPLTDADAPKAPARKRKAAGAG